MTAHAILRAKERYGLDLTAADIANISALCVTGKAMLVRTTPGSNHRQFVVGWKGCALIAWVTPDGAILTFEPADALAAGKSRTRGRKRMGKAHNRAGKGPKSRRKTWGY